MLKLFDRDILSGLTKSCIMKYRYHNPFLSQLLGLNFRRLRTSNDIKDRNGGRRQLRSTWHVTRLDQIIQLTLISSCEVCDDVNEGFWFSAGFQYLYLKKKNNNNNSNDNTEVDINPLTP